MIGDIEPAADENSRVVRGAFQFGRIRRFLSLIMRDAEHAGVGKALQLTLTPDLHDSR
jgi:hypothetical protein